MVTEPPPDVSIIIAHLDDLGMLQTCVETVARLSGPSFEVILVDNGSHDGTAEWAARCRPDIRLIRNTENLGFAPAANQGARIARGRYLLFLNDDTTVPPDLLERLVAPLEADPTIGSCQPKIFWMGRPGELDSLGEFPTWTGFLQHDGHRGRDVGTDPRAVVEIFSPKGACLLVRRDVFERVGGFDDAFFAYCEETDLAWRIQLAGFRIVLVPGAGMEHRVGHTTTRTLPFSVIQFHSHKNRFAMYLKNLGGPLLCYVLLVNGTLTAALAAAALLCGKLGRAGAIGRAWWWNVRHLAATWRKRRIVQRQIRRRSDRQILQPFLRPATWDRAWRGGLLWYVKAEEKRS
ncbi:MAG: glycosyltransferase [Candidatus Omnitrophica bacterium]|nr:glycosyltransferase [Candidatus Omnitrophota bacterium]